MRCELPVVRRCCCCLPLRPGLLAWAYLKLVFNLCFLIVLVTKMTGPYPSNEMLVFGILLFTVIDIVFLIFFIISAYRKDYKKIRIFYRYSIFCLCPIVVLIGVLIGYCAFFLYSAPPELYILILYLGLGPIIVSSLIMGIVSLFFQVYLIILVRSEFIKLKNKSKIEFVNHAADEKCIANLDCVKDSPVTV
ncbi:uncharacterized protein [Maniola hyperantus]|uniref:uncharacterized protein n=1 Tax=Aphantopus hyperantus TaxID=2795564 RepID=UPI00374A944C